MARRNGVLAAALVALGWMAEMAGAAAQEPSPPRDTPAALSGHAAFGDWRGDAPGTVRRIAPADLPAPFATGSASDSPSEIPRPGSARPQVLPGFEAQLFASGLDGPRLLRTAPNGDILVAESAPGRIRLLRGPDGAARPERIEVFASGLDQPFGLAFYPPGPDPRWLYVGETNRIVRFPYQEGDLKARGPAETVVARLAPTSAGHWTRDIAFSLDGTRMFVSVGSESNAGENLGRRDPAWTRAWEERHGVGASWGPEESRADVLVFSPDGTGQRTFATGLRNCVGLAVHPRTGDLWCSANERDGLGDNLPPDFVTRVREGAFYGWPWFYIGGSEDPRHRGERPDLKDRVTVPDVLIQPHSAPLQLTFGTGLSLRPEDRDSAFVALHGSWNRARPTGYKIVRVILRDGTPTGEYEDVVTGFVADGRHVWARPVGIAVAHDGALLISEDANGTIWRVARR